MIYTDASKDSVGAVLAQDGEGLEEVVASVVDRELWAILWAVRKFKHYVGLSAFSIITDYHPLLGFRHMAIDNDPTGRSSRWILELDPFDWVMAHKYGSRHKNADTLSRWPVVTLSQLLAESLNQHPVHPLLPHAWT